MSAAAREAVRCPSTHKLACSTEISRFGNTLWQHTLANCVPFRLTHKVKRCRLVCIAHILIHLLLVSLLQRKARHHSARRVLVVNTVRTDCSLTWRDLARRKDTTLVVMQARRRAGHLASDDTVMARDVDVHMSVAAKHVEESGSLKHLRKRL